MSLYDDDDVVKADTSGTAAGWATGVNKFNPPKATLHNTMKKPSMPISPMLKPHSKLLPSSAPSTPMQFQGLPPVMNLSNKKGNNSLDVKKFAYSANAGDKFRDKSLLPINDTNWTVVNEYDPLWPNEYHKVVQEIRDNGKRDRSPEDNKKRRYQENTRDRTRDRYSSSGGAGAPAVGGPAGVGIGGGVGSTGSSAPTSGFGKKPDLGEYSEDEMDGKKFNRRGSDQRGGGGDGRRPGATQGAAIAPPPSLNEDTRSEPESPQGGSLTQKLGSTLANPGLGVAAKIMAKYGYKHGQGLGKTEQGMSQALAVEKTSKRGGRILHEKDFIPPPPVGAAAFGESSTTPPHMAMPPPPGMPPGVGGGEYGDVVPGVPAPGDEPADDESKVSITDLMKNPGKVVLCKNMVGPGEVDGELEPEVKEECNVKYGDVQKVIIFELPNAVPEEAVRIFIEFKRVESAIKAVVDLNGRFFGGRQVQARFYDPFRFSKLELHD